MNCELYAVIKKRIEDALGELYKRDYYLIQFEPENNEIHGSNHHVGERSIVFRFAYYFQKLISGDRWFEGLNLDCEYNRNHTHIKDLPGFPSGTFPDVIIHKRGSNKDNILVMEFKTYWNDDQKKDREKIQEFTSQSGEYKFQYGMTVLIKKEKAIVKVFNDSKDIEELSFEVNKEGINNE